MESIGQDLWRAWRCLRKIPTFSAAAVLTLALGIGANSAIFSVVESVLLRPLPYRDPSTLVQIWNTYPPIVPQGPNSAGDFRDFRRQARSFSAMGAYVDTPRGLNLTGDGEPARLEMRFATSGLFPMLGLDPPAGRGFTPEEDNPGTSPIILISHRLWQTRFNSNPATVGRTLTLDGRGYTVAGVVSAGLRLAPTTDIWMPIGQYDGGPDPYRYHEFNVIGRLKPDVRIEQAQAELTTLNSQAQAALPNTHKNFGVQVIPLRDPSAAKMQTALLVLFGAVLFVLLVGCANFVNLLMARNASRQKELALRVALGAGRRRLLSELLSESILLALAGGGTGIGLATWGLRVVQVFAPADLAAVKNATINLRVLAFTLTASLLSGIACGLVPAFQSLKSDVHASLKEGGRTAASPRGQAVARLLVVAEIALAIIPLTGAGLLVRSFQRLLEVDPGFRRDHILAMEIDQPQLPPPLQGQLPDDQRLELLRRQSAEYDLLIQRIQALPGVKAAGGISVLPLGAAMRSASRFVIEGQTVPPDGVRPVAETRNISSGYFSAMEIPLRMGRLLDAHDYASQNIVINEAMAQKFWPTGNAIGKRINFCSLAHEPCWVDVVGVVGNVHQYGLEAAPTLDSYGMAGWTPYTVVRTASDPVAFEKPVMGEIHRFDPALPVTHVMTLDNLLADSVSPRRFSAFLLAVFAGLALLLATIGVYAVMSYAVRLRTNEIGVRMALGARPRSVCYLIVSGGSRLVIAGITLGMAGSLALAKVISTLLYGVTATDPITLVGVALLLGFVALLACYLPARQAMRIDPLDALRRE